MAMYLDIKAQQQAEFFCAGSLWHLWLISIWLMSKRLTLLTALATHKKRPLIQSGLF